jgi:hypothetical protein
MALVGRELVPKDIRWPDEVDYTKSLVQSVYDISDFANMPISEGGALTPPVMNQVNALRMVLEGVSNLPLGQLAGLISDIYALSQAASPEQVVAAASSLIASGLDLVITGLEAVGAALDLAADVLNMIPLVGQALGAVLELVTGLLAAEASRAAAMEQLGQQCQDLADRQQLAFCQRLMNQASPEGTGEGSQITPADIFRPILYAQQKMDVKLPLSIASMYVLLCAGAAYDDLASAGFSPMVILDISRLYKEQSGNPNIGVPLSLQKKMWSLIKGIMASSRCPEIYCPDLPRGTGGHELMPILNDIVLTLYDSGHGRGPNHLKGYGIDDGYLDHL